MRPQATPVTHIEDARFRATEWRFAPGAETGWHVHGHDYVVVPLTDGELLLDRAHPAHRALQASMPPVSTTASAPASRSATASPRRAPTAMVVGASSTRATAQAGLVANYPTDVIVQSFDEPVPAALQVVRFAERTATSEAIERLDGALGL